MGRERIHSTKTYRRTTSEVFWRRTNAARGRTGAFKRIQSLLWCRKFSRCKTSHIFRGFCAKSEFLNRAGLLGSKQQVILFGFDWHNQVRRQIDFSWFRLHACTTGGSGRSRKGLTSIRLNAKKFGKYEHKITSRSRFWVLGWKTEIGKWFAWKRKFNSSIWPSSGSSKPIFWR